MKIGELFIALGFDVDDKKLKDFDNSVKAAQASMLKMGAAAAGVVWGINRFMADSVKASVGLRNVANETGVAEEAMLRFYNVAGRLNTELTLDNVMSLFQNLNSQIQQTFLGGGNSGPLAMLGVGMDSLSEGPLGVIAALRNNMEKNNATWGRERTIEIMRQAGIGPEWLRVIQASDDEWENHWKKVIPTESQRQAMIKMAETYREFSISWMNLKFRISEKIAPFFGQFIDMLIEKAIPALEGFASRIPAFTSQISHLYENVATGAQIYMEMFKGLETIFDSPMVQGGLISFLVLLALRLNPVVTLVAALVAGLNELGKYVKGEENWIDKSLDSAAALATQIPGGENLPGVKERLQKMGLSIDDFETNRAHKIYQSLIEGMHSDPDSFIGGQKESLRARGLSSYANSYGGVPQPTPMSNQSIIYNNNINIESAAPVEDLFNGMWESIDDRANKSNQKNMTNGVQW